MEEQLGVVVVIAALVVGGVSAAKARALGTLLVLTEFTVDEASRSVRIVGRAPGVVAFVLSTLGLDTKTTLFASEADVHFKTTSLAGEQIRSTPITQIASVGVGYSKPILLLILAGVSALFGLFGLFSDAGMAALGVGVFFALVLVVAYALRKEITIAVETTGSLTFGVRFRRSVIENVAVDIDKAKAAMDVIARNVVMSQGKVAVSPGTLPAPGAAPPAR